MLFDPKWTPKIPAPPIKRKNLTKREIELLLRVREGLLDGTISKRQFQMDMVADVHTRCGTVGCIAGWMGVFEMVDDGISPSQIKKHIFAQSSRYFSRVGASKFHALFHGFFRDGDDEIGPQDGIKAIDRFLVKEDPWG